MNIRTSPKPECPECGAKMVLRQPRPDQEWKPFWGCPYYPACDGTRNIMPDGTPEEDDIDLDENDWREGHPYDYED